MSAAGHAHDAFPDYVIVPEPPRPDDVPPKRRLLRWSRRRPRVQPARFSRSCCSWSGSLRPRSGSSGCRSSPSRRPSSAAARSSSSSRATRSVSRTRGPDRRRPRSRPRSSSGLALDLVVDDLGDAGHSGGVPDVPAPQREGRALALHAVLDRAARSSSDSSGRPSFHTKVRRTICMGLLRRQVDVDGRIPGRRLCANHLLPQGGASVPRRAGTGSERV